MDNKLGVSKFKFDFLEKEIINAKIRLLDEYVTFGRERMDFEYLKNLNSFLFSDLYDLNEIGVRKLTVKEVDLIQMVLSDIEEICINEKNVDIILEKIVFLWKLQVFNTGNTRTLFTYLKVLNDAYLLNLDIDLNIEIESKPSMFNIDNFVNQKRLTKIK